MVSEFLSFINTASLPPAHRQRGTDKQSMDTINDELQSALTDPRQNASCSSLVSGDWLNAFLQAAYG